MIWKNVKPPAGDRLFTHKSWDFGYLQESLQAYFIKKSSKIYAYNLEKPFVQTPFIDILLQELFTPFTHICTYPDTPTLRWSDFWKKLGTCKVVPNCCRTQIPKYHLLKLLTFGTQGLKIFCLILKSAFVSLKILKSCTWSLDKKSFCPFWEKNINKF